jgi:hypothetical protein
VTTDLSVNAAVFGAITSISIMLILVVLSYIFPAPTDKD